MSPVKTIIVGATLAIAAITVTGAHAVLTDAQAHLGFGMRKAQLLNASGVPIGSVKFLTIPGDKVGVTIEISAATPGFHGIHIHANDNPVNGVGCVPPTFVSADGHFTLPGAIHGEHAGDFPNILINAEGRGFMFFVTDRFRLEDLPGRAVIFHAGADNHGNIPTSGGLNDYTPNSPGAVALTHATGNAGARTACGVID